MNTEWVKSLKLDYVATEKMMVVEGKTFRHKQYEEYKTTHLHTPYRVIVLMLNRIYGRADGKFYKFWWIPLMYHIAMEGIVFNWSNIIARNLSTFIKAAQEGLWLGKFEFHMSSFLVDCIL